MKGTNRDRLVRRMIKAKGARESDAAEHAAARWVEEQPGDFGVLGSWEGLVSRSDRSHNRGARQLRAFLLTLAVWLPLLALAIVLVSGWGWALLGVPLVAAGVRFFPIVAFSSQVWILLFIGGIFMGVETVAGSFFASMTLTR